MSDNPNDENQNASNTDQESSSDEESGGEGLSSDSVTKLTDNIGIVAVSELPEMDGEHHATTVSLEYLKQAVDILETLGWKQIDLSLVSPDRCSRDDAYPMPVFRPSPGAYFVDDNAALTVAPRTEQGRSQEAINDE